MKSGSAEKFLWGSMEQTDSTSCNFSPEPTQTGIRKYLAELDGPHLILAVPSWEKLGSFRKSYCLLAKNNFLVHNADHQLSNLYGELYDGISVTWFSS
jgi:hypothetical protein